MVPEDRKYVIFDCSELDSVDFAEVLENSSETVRKSVDETKTFVKYNGDMPDSVSALTTKTQEYNHTEILGILSGTLNGLWFIFLGAFLYFVAGASYQQVIIKETLAKVPLKGLIEKKYVKIKPEAKLFDVIKKYANIDKDTFIVKKKGVLAILDFKRIESMKPEMQKRIKVSQVMLTKFKSLNLKMNSYQAFKSIMAS